MVEQEVARFLEAFRGRRVGPTITALRERVIELARAEAERAIATLGGGAGERERRAMLDLADAIAKKLLHGPQVVLKKGGGDPVDGPSLLAAAQKMFNLEIKEPAEAAAASGGASAADSGDEEGAGSALAGATRLSGKATGT
jgi:glutamyl-tRNA reductase